MKFSTKRINEWLIVLLLLILVPVVFSFIRGDLYFLPDNLHYVFNTHPTTNILGINTQNAIAIFSGNEPLGYSIKWETIFMFFNVVLYLMIGPYLLFKGYKKARENENRTKPWYWFAGGVICLGALSIIPVELLHIKVFENTKESSDESRTRDKMRAELAEVGFATAQYEILEDGIDDSFKVESLDLKNLKYEYSVESIESDTLITIAVSNPDIPDFNVRMEVRPYSQKLLNQRN